MAKAYSIGNKLQTINVRILSSSDIPIPPVLPPFTIRARFASGYTPTMGDSQTLVDAEQNIWDITRNSTDWSALFKDNSSLYEILGANSTGVTIMGGLLERGIFSGCYNLKSVALFDTSSVVDMSYMFRYCLNLEAVPLFDTSNVTNMFYAFRYCSKLSSIPLFNTSNVTNMCGTFSNCLNLTTVPLFDTSKVTNMSEMFHCNSTGSKLTTVPLFNTSNVTDMGTMFFACGSLISVPVFDTSKVTNMDSMFANCSSLTSVPLLNTSNVTNMRGMFKWCRKVESGALALYQQASTQAIPPTDHTYTFDECGRWTPTGAAELAQIPADWGGTAS